MDGRTMRRERTRRRILDETRRLVEDRDLATVSMDDVADAAEVTRRTVYDHFGSRAGLLVALAQQADEDMDLGARLVPVFAAATGRDAIHRFVEVVADVTPPLLDLATAIERARAHDPDAGAAWDDRMAGRFEACMGLASRLAAEADLCGDVTVEEAAAMLYEAIAWQRWEILVVERGWSPEQWVARTKHQLDRTLLADPPV